MGSRKTKAKAKPWLCVLITVALASSIVLAVALSSTFKPTIPDSEQDFNQQQEALPNTSNDISDEPGSSPDNSTNNSLPYVISLDNSTNHILADVGKNNASGIDFLPSGNKSNPETKPANYTISKEEAINLAMPYFQDYASANNRTIKSIYTYFDYVPDYRGLRGSVSQTYPVWEITASYVGVVNYNNPETWIVGYTVSIWADTGEAYSANPQGFM